MKYANQHQSFLTLFSLFGTLILQIMLLIPSGLPRRIDHFQTDYMSFSLLRNSGGSDTVGSNTA